MFNRAEASAGTCRTLVGDLQTIIRGGNSEAATVARVAERLACVADERRWLVGHYRKVEPKTYRQHLVYVAPDRCFSIVALTWGAGAQTPIHDHAGWCAVAVHEGVEYEKRYRVRTDARDAYLEETGTRALEPGAAVGMVADGLDIHRVGNHTRGVTLSLHVYGVDIERTGTSIKSRFDDYAVRA